MNNTAIKDPQNTVFAAYMRDLDKIDDYCAADETGMALDYEEKECLYWDALLSSVASKRSICKTLLRKKSGIVEPLYGKIIDFSHNKKYSKEERLKLILELREADGDRKLLLKAQKIATKYSENTIYQTHVARAFREMKAAKDKFFNSNLKLVLSISKKYRGFHGLMGISDIVAEGNIGLIKAVEKFNPHKGYKFSTYGSWWIRHMITRSMADKYRAIRLPVHVLDDAYKMKKFISKYENINGYSPSDREIEEFSGLSKARLTIVLDAENNKPVSTDAPVNRLGDSTKTVSDYLVDESFISPVDGLILKQESDDLMNRFSILSDVERSVINGRFGIGGKEQTLEELGQKHSLSRERIRQIQEKALTKIRNQYRKAGTDISTSLDKYH